MSAGLEAMLARLYADDELLARFLVDPEAALARQRLTPAEREALLAIDRVGLRLAAESFRGKRAHRDSR